MQSGPTLSMGVPVGSEASLSSYPESKIADQASVVQDGGLRLSGTLSQAEEFFFLRLAWLGFFLRLAWLGWLGSGPVVFFFFVWLGSVFSSSGLARGPFFFLLRLAWLSSGLARLAWLGARFCFLCVWLGSVFFFVWLGSAWLGSGPVFFVFFFVWLGSVFSSSGLARGPSFLVFFLRLAWLSSGLARLA